jgi:hypothetical protein
MDEVRLPGIITALSLTGFVIGLDCDGTQAWQKITALSLTGYWSWNEMRLMRFPGRKSLQHHSLAVGHGMGWDEAGTKSVHCHSLPVSHGMRYDGTTWQKISLLSLTICWSCDEM